jgi:hypothetical protein
MTPPTAALEARPVTVYRIRNWSTNFENNRSRVMRTCRYVCMPNKQDGLGLTRILAQPDGAAIFGVWCLILQACSRQSVREGWLTDDGTAAGRPWDLDDIAFRWRRSPAEIQRTIEIVCADKVGWMERLDADCPSAGTATSLSAPKCAFSEIEGREGIEGTGGAGAASLDREDLSKPSLPPTITPQQHLRRLRAIGLWLRDDEEAEVAIEAIGLYGGAAMVARATAIKHGRPEGRIFLSELTVGASAPQPSAAAPLSDEAKRTVIAVDLVARLGWEACADAADLPRDRILTGETMVEAMRDPGIFDRVVAKTGGLA